MSLEPKTAVGVIGAGAMGSGIARVAAAAGHRVVLADAAQGAGQRAQAAIANGLEREIQRERLDRDTADSIQGRIDFQWAPLREDLSAYRPCELVIEAIVEDLVAKQELFRRLEQFTSGDAVLATNTSSLSITSIASACTAPERVMGLHFFNPAPVMQLVEVVPWLGSDPTITSALHSLMQEWRKTPAGA